MKKLVLILLVLLIANSGNTQIKADDIGIIVLNSYLPNSINLPEEAKNILLNKLTQITTNNGIAGSQINPRFIITANINVGTKDIIAGPPQMIAQNIDVILFIGDAIDNVIFSNTTLSLKGVGTNENKAFIDAIKNINPKSKAVMSLLEEGKNKIINYYNAQCDYILTEASTLAKQVKFDEAIYNLSVIPKVCKDCSNKASTLIESIYQQKINSICIEKYNQAKIIWAGVQNISTAATALNTLTGINPNASCNTDIQVLIKEINSKLIADEKVQLELIMKKYNDKIRLEEKQIDAIKEIAVEFAKNQQKKIFNNNNIYWR